jgi:cell division protein FtsB
MQKFQAKRRFRKVIYSVPTLFLLLAAVLFLAYAVWGSYQKYQLSMTVLNEAERERDSVGARRATLEASIAKLSTDRGVEENLRENFQVAKPGEQVVVLLESTTTAATSTPVAKPWWKFW